MIKPTQIEHTPSRTNSTVGQKNKIYIEEVKIMGIDERLIPRPRICFMLALFLVLIAGAMATTSFVLRKRVDSLGNVMMDPNGQPMFEVDRWASFWRGWPSNIPWVLAQFFVILGIVLWIRGKYLAAKSLHQESKNIAQQAAPSNR